MAAEGAEERRPRIPGKPIALKANNHFTQNNSRISKSNGADVDSPTREPFATFSRLNTSSKTYSHSPARHLTHKKSETVAPHLWGSTRWGGGPYKTGSSKPKERYSEVIRIDNGSGPDIENNLEAPMLEVITALQDHGEELLPLATALRRLMESGDLTKKSNTKRSSSATPRLAVWPHKLIDNTAAEKFAPQQVPQTAPHITSRLTSTQNEQPATIREGTETTESEPIISLDATQNVAVTYSAASIAGSRFDHLFRTQNGLASRMNDVVNIQPTLPIDSAIEDLVDKDLAQTAARISGERSGKPAVVDNSMSRAIATARALDATFASTVPATESSELQRLLELSSQAKELHPRTVLKLATCAKSTSSALRRASVYLARHTSKIGSESDVSDALPSIAALHSLVSGSMSELLDGLINVSRVTAESLEQYRNNYDTAVSRIAELTEERDQLILREQASSQS